MLEGLLITLFLIVCLLLVIVVLLQKGRGGGLSGAFGGVGAGSAFGTRTGDVFTWVTIVLTGLFLLLAIVATLLARPPLGAAALPQFRPPAWPEGRTEREVKVTMTSPTKGATIRYTLNGREPTEKSEAYGKSSVIVTYGQTLQARTFRVGMEPSETLSVTYEAPPQTQPSTQPTTAPAILPSQE